MADTIVGRFFATARARRIAPAYAVEQNQTWVTTTWGEYADAVRQLACAMLGLSLVPGDCVAILASNRPEWVMADLAAMAVGAVPAGIYTTCSAAEIQYIVSHCQAKLVFVETQEQLARLQSIAPQLRAAGVVPAVVAMPGLAVPTTTGAAPGEFDVLSWAQLVASGNGIPSARVDARTAELGDDDLATLIYTSGTTGNPKAVMLTHHNLAWTAQALVSLGTVMTDEVMVSYLPLSHIAEQLGSIHLPATLGSMIYFCPQVERLIDVVKVARPTVFFAVPRVWEKLQAGVAAKLGQASGVKKQLLQWARDINRQAVALGHQAKPLPRRLAAQKRLADRLVNAKFKQALGLDRVRNAATSAAPISPDVLNFFASLDVPIYELYGQSEDSGPTSTNLPGATKVGTVGRAVPGVSVRIADDGEIMVKGPNVFKGYLHDVAATAEALPDGWLASGDLGVIDADGYLSITGRKKEIIITAGGKNIAPVPIENAIKRCERVVDVVVIGDRRKHLTALVTLAPGISNDAATQAAIGAAVETANADLARVEQIKKWHVLPSPFGIATGEYTPTMKLRRSVIAKMYAAEIEAMYADG